MSASPDISIGLAVIMDYKYGRINLDEAVEQFCFLTGLSQALGRQFLEGLSRSNVIEFEKDPN